MEWGNESLLKWSWSHDQDGSRAHIIVQTLKKIFFSGTKRPMTLILEVDLDLIFGKFKFGPLCFCMGKW